MKFTVITLFPQMIEAMAQSGLVGQAAVKGSVQISTIYPRDFTSDVHGTVDDRVYGGADGMVMKVEPLKQAIARAREESPGGRVIVMSPQGRPWNQDMAADFAKRAEPMILVCGRYAGIDNRLTVLHADDEISVGDYILNGGEVAACVIIESVARLLPEVLGNRESVERDSFVTGVLECPQFTRPREVDGLPVPAPLLSGNHALIAEFEDAVSTVRTAFLRPDLLPKSMDFSAELDIVFALNDLELKSLGLNRSVLNSLRKK